MGANGVEVARISVKVWPNTKEFRTKLKKELEEIERTVKGDVHVTAHLDSAQARADFQRMKSQMQKSGNIRVGVDLDPKGGGGRGSSGGDRDLQKNGKILGLINEMTAGIKGPSLGTGINLAGYAVILGGITAVAAPLIGLVSAALLSLPGLLSMVLAPVAAITLGLDGFKAAAEKIKPQFDGLRKVMADAAETSFTPVMSRIANEVFPRLEKSLPAVTTGLAKMADGVLDAFNRPENATKWQNAITNIGNSLGAMKPGVDGFTSGFITLIDQFSLKLPAITEWFNGAGKGFMDELNRMASSGELSRMFDGLGETIKSLLSSITEMAKTGLNFVSDPAKMQGFLNVLKQILGTMEAIVKVSDGIGKIWSWNPGTWVDRALRSVGLNDDYKAPGEVGILDSIEAAKNGSNISGLGNQADTAAGQMDSLALSMKNADFAANQQQKDLALLMGGTAPAPIQGPGLQGDYPLPGGKPAEAGAAPKIPAPDTTEAVAKLQEYQTSAETTMQAAKTAVESATSGAKVSPPDLGDFTGALDGLADSANQAMRNVVTSIEAGGASASAAAAAAGNSIYQSMLGVVPMFQTVGLQMMAGLASGITAGSAFAITAAVSAATAALDAAKGALGIKSPSRKFAEIGDYAMQGMAVGMEDGFAPVLDQAKDMAGKIADAFANGADPTTEIAGFTGKEISRMEKVLGFESKKLSVQARALDYQAKKTGDASLKAKADELRLQKEGIDLEKDMMSLTREFGDSSEDSKNPFADQIKTMLGMPVDFAKATAGQAMQDLGISGGGALTTLADTALDFGSQFVFNVSNIDQAMAVQKSQQAKQTMSYGG